LFEIFINPNDIQEWLKFAKKLTGQVDRGDRD